MRGSIRQRSANSWLLQIELDRVGGKRHRRFVTVKGSKKDAEKELTRILTAADAGTLPDPTRMTVGEYVRQSLDAAHALSPKTLERYRELADRQIIPHLGGVKISKLRPEHVAAWHGTLLATKLSPRTIKNAHGVLSRVLGEAVQYNVIAVNVARKVEPPAVEHIEMEILKPNQVKGVLAALHGHALYPIVALALATGMRRGELLGLQWADVDLDRGVIRVERSVEETDKGLRVKPPKTKSGRRNVAISADAIAMLRDHRKGQLELRLQLGQGGQPALVFSTIEGEHLSPDGVSRNWRRVCEAKKLPLVPFHALRHTSVSLMLSAGADILTVSRRIGHRKASITLDVYGHLIDGSDAKAAKALEGLLK